MYSCFYILVCIYIRVCVCVCVRTPVRASMCVCVCVSGTMGKVRDVDMVLTSGGKAVRAGDWLRGHVRLVLSRDVDIAGQ